MEISTRLQDLKSSAFFWYGFGLHVIPVIPRKKTTAVKWDSWLSGLCPEAIDAHWTKNSDHEVGCIVGDNLVVFDADSPASISELVDLEQGHGLVPGLVVTTSRGQHHYFRRASGTYAKSDSHSTETHPERIDVKTGRALVVLPPSGGRQVTKIEGDDVDFLSVANQAFVDAVFRHNGRQAPRPPAVKTSSPETLPPDLNKATARINAMLQHVDPDCGYDDWLHILMGIFYETGGSEQGFAIANAWSSTGDKYRGEDEIRTKWSSFENFTGTPVTLGTLIKMLADRGVDWLEVCDAIEPQFVPCDYEVIPQNHQLPIPPENPLSRYSLMGRLQQLEKESVHQKMLLGNVALVGQSTVFYAAPNIGKTLITLWMVIQAIETGIIDPSSIYYIDVDDSQAGVVQKLRLAEQHGFHLLAEGNCGFRANVLLDILTELMSKGQCRGVVIILDTLKKFTDVMDKRASTEFSKVIRRFVMQGGTSIALAHVNKNIGADGRPVYAGTSDIVEDADCAHTLRVIGGPDPQIKVVEFENIKRRGNVCRRAAYSYSNAVGISYSDLVDSVQPVEDTEVSHLTLAADLGSDGEVIDAVTECIREGIDTKMKLAVAAAERSGVSKRAALRIIEKYAGSNPDVHRWIHEVGDRGAKKYRLIPAGTDSAE